MDLQQSWVIDFELNGSFDVQDVIAFLCYVRHNQWPIFVLVLFPFLMVALMSQLPPPSNPYLSPANPLPSLPPIGTPGGGLGSLTQTARLDKLNSARNTLIVIGILSLLVNGGMMFFIPSQVDEAIKNGNINPDARPFILGVAFAIQGLGILFSIVLIVLGALVKRYPVFSTIAGFVVYLVGNLFFMLLDPANFARGSIIKIFIAVALARAIGTAWAYRQEEVAEQQRGSLASL